jgi:uncharacterized protein YraI/beta-lactamase class A
MLKRTFATSIVAVLCVFFVATLLLSGASQETAAQDGTQTPTVFASAINPNANVRFGPGTDYEVAGQIQPGDSYGVRGRSFEWVLIDYQGTSVAQAWVHRSVVNLTASFETLPEIDPFVVPTLAPGTGPDSSPGDENGDTETQPATFTPPPQLSSEPLPGVQPTLADPEDELERRLDLVALYLAQPLELAYQGSRIILDPLDIEFQMDRDAMRERLRAGLDNPDFNPILVENVAASYSETALREFLEEVAANYTPAGSSQVFDYSNLTFRRNASRTELDIEQAITLIDAALRAPDAAFRRLELPLRTVTTEGSTMEDLREAIVSYVELDGREVEIGSPDSVVSVFVMDLNTGAEMGINERVQHSAVSTLKIGFMVNYFRHQLGLPEPELSYSLAASIICSSNPDSNLLITRSGEGSRSLGLQRVNKTLCEAGAVNSYVLSMLSVGPIEGSNLPADYYDTVSRVPCVGAESEATAPDTSLDTGADPLLRTTALDLGVLLMNIYECAQYNTGLATIFPDEVTQTECQYMLELLEGTYFQRLGEMGIPEDVNFVHKVGYLGDTVGDAGIVFSPGGDYVFVMFLWDNRMAVNQGQYALRRWDLLGDVSRIVYNYFNPDSPLLQTRTPPNSLGGAGCVLPLNTFDLDLQNIDNNRFDEEGNPVPSACYDWPDCRPFEGWER